MLRERWLRAQLMLLKQKARAGKDVHYWVEYLFENQEEPGCDAVFYALEHGATLEDLLQFDPEIGENLQLKAWFEKLYAELSTALNEDVDSPRKGGNAPDPGGDDKASAY